MERILLAHGGGGEETQKLIKDLIFKYLDNPILEKMEDASILQITGNIAYTTDSFTVSPIFFKGGDIGKLSIAGTVNDLSVMGAKPTYLSCSFIIEEGLPLSDFEKILKSMSEELNKVGAKVVTGDTKVVPKGTIDKIFINTSGIGPVLKEGISASNLREGDKIIVSGTVGDHGACIMAEREGIDMEGDLISDCASVWGLVEEIINANIDIRAMRDPTRGGLSAVLNEWAEQSNVGIEIFEDKIPVKDTVQGFCELLGLEPYTLANEGKFVIAVPDKDAEKTISIMKKHKLGKDSSIIGKVTSEHRGKVILKTPYGSKRIMEKPAGELLPRIC